jgi:hypothetical protein
MTPGAGLVADVCIMDIAPPCEVTDTNESCPAYDSSRECLK